MVCLVLPLALATFAPTQIKILNYKEIRNLSENEKVFELNENKNMANQNLWDVVKDVLQRKWITLNAYIRKKRKVEKSMTYHKMFKKNS